MTNPALFVNKCDPYNMTVNLYDDQDIYYVGPENEVGSLRVEIVASTIAITGDYLEYIEQIAPYPVVPGKRYSFQCWTRSEQMNWVGTVGVRWYGADGEQVGNYAVNADLSVGPLEWVFVQGAYWAPDDAVEARLALYTISNVAPALDVLWFDEMVLQDEQVAPATAIANPDFDTDVAGWVAGPSGWGNVAGEFHHVPDDGVDAPGCLAIHITDLTTAGAYYDLFAVTNATILPATKGQFVTIGGYVKTDNPALQPTFGIQNYNVHGKQAGSAVSPHSDYPANQWLYLELDDHVLYSDTVGISISLVSTINAAAAVGTVFFDDIRLTNYVEPITVSHWSMWTSDYVNAQVTLELAITHSDNGSVRMDLTDSGVTKPADNANWASLTERIIVQPNRVYHVEGWVYSYGGSWFPSLGVQWYDANGNATAGWPGFMITPDLTQTPGQWYFMSDTVTSPSDATYCLLILHAVPKVNVATGFLCFDEVRVIDTASIASVVMAVNEPVTLVVPDNLLPDDVSDTGQQLSVLPTRWYV